MHSLHRFFGIYKKTFNIINSWRSIFINISMFFNIFCFYLSLANIPFSREFPDDIVLNQIVSTFINQTQLARSGLLPSLNSDHLSLYELTVFVFVKAECFIFVLIMYIATTSAAIYAVACIYVGQDLTPKKVINSKKAWKGIMINFFCTFIAFFAYNIAAILVIVACDRLMFVVMSSRVLILTGYIVIALVYLAGLVYLGIVWQLANVVSVLEESRGGFQAMKKSKELLKENILMAMIIFVKMGVVYYVVLSALGKMYMKVYENMLVNPLSLGMVVGVIAFTILCLIVLMVLKSLELVVPTVVYFDCKSYHHENVDKLALSDHLDQHYAAREEYLPLKTTDDIQPDKFNNV